MSETIAGNAVKMPHFDYAVLDVKVGNGAKMHEALKQILALAKARGLFEIQSLSETALAEPPRNCDVGTVEERAKRYHEFCRGRVCETCPALTAKKDDSQDDSCIIRWEDMPYEKEGAE